MSFSAAGHFEVKIHPQPQGAGEGPVPGRMLLDKEFHGQLQAISKGQMLAWRDNELGSGGYVAMEQVDGVLDKRIGSFILQHSGTMDRGAAHLTLTVVPDSGTGDLKGISGRMSIQIVAGKHTYHFEYSLPALA